MRTVRYSSQFKKDVKLATKRGYKMTRLYEIMNLIPEEVVKLMAKPMFPNWLYVLVAHFGWRNQAKKYGVHKKLHDRPYQN